MRHWTKCTKGLKFKYVSSKEGQKMKKWSHKIEFVVSHYVAKYEVNEFWCVRCSLPKSVRKSVLIHHFSFITSHSKNKCKSLICFRLKCDEWRLNLILGFLDWFCSFITKFSTKQLFLVLNPDYSCFFVIKTNQSINQSINPG